jgi:hypothetical protein
MDIDLAAKGYCVLAPRDLTSVLGYGLDVLEQWHREWDDLPLDTHLKDAGRYRRRRHACFVVDGDEVRRASDRPHWQPIEYNALHGGIERRFAAMRASWTSQSTWHRLLACFAGSASRLRGHAPWYVEAHPFRIDAGGGIGRPTPEGAHRDGVDLVVVMLVRRVGVTGGETRVFEADSPSGVRFTMTEPWTALVLDDERMIHETTPIQPAGRGPHYRDTLVLTFRAGGFQGPSQER